MPLTRRVWLIISTIILATTISIFADASLAAAAPGRNAPEMSNTDDQQVGPIGSPNGFTQSQITQVSPPGLIIEMPGQPPKQNNDPNYGYYPLTSAAVKAYSCMKTTWTPPSGGGCITLIWDLRCTAPSCGSLKPSQLDNSPKNPVDGNEIRLGYSSIARAMGAMEAGIDWSTNCTNGYTGYLQWTEAVGIPDSNVYTYSDFLTAFDAGNIPYYQWGKGGIVYDVPGTGNTASDVVVLPMAQACNLASNLNTKIIELDEERADQPTAAQLISYYDTLSSITQNQGYKLSVWVDDLEGRNARLSGLTATTIPQIMALPNFQQLLFKLVANNPQHNLVDNWNAQMTVIGGGVLPEECSPIMQHLGIGMQLPDQTASDWATMNQLLTEWCVPVLEPFLNKNQLGGVNCYNGEPVLNPQKWGNGIGIPVQCSDPEH